MVKKAKKWKIKKYNITITILEKEFDIQILLCYIQII